MVYALTQSNWANAGTLAFIEALTFVLYRTEKQNRLPRAGEHPNGLSCLGAATINVSTKSR
jgi:ABC-type uncharacterized transport system permease subunit